MRRHCCGATKSTTTATDVIKPTLSLLQYISEYDIQFVLNKGEPTATKHPSTTFSRGTLGREILFSFSLCLGRDIIITMGAWGWWWGWLILDLGKIQACTAAGF